MILNSPYITGSLTVTGNANVQGTLTVTGSLSGTASLALNSDLLQGTGSVGFSTTASLLEVSSSQQQISASLLNVIANYATTGSNSFRANQSITGSLVVSSTITAQTLVVQTVTSSIVYSSGSNIFGSALGDRQTFTGSVNITGSLALAGNITGNAVTLTGALGGTSATFSSSVTATSDSTLFKEGFRINATTTGGGGSQPAYTYYTAAGSKRWSTFLNVGDDKFHIANASNSELFTITQGGNVGIGTITPLSALDVRAANATMGNYQTIQAFSTDSAAINLGGGISLGGYYTSTTSIAQFASIVGRKENGTSGNYDGYLAFGTNAQATGVVERMRITSGGNVAIGRTSPLNVNNYDANRRFLTIQATTGGVDRGAYLELIGTAGGSPDYWLGRVSFSSTTTSANNHAEIISLTDSGGSYSGCLIFSTSANASTTAPVERMRITSAGPVDIGGWGTGTDISLRIKGNSNGQVGFFNHNGQLYMPYLDTSTGTDLVLTSGGYINKKSSSIRYKKNVQPIDIGLNFILSLNPVSYNLKDNNAPQVGFIAEDFPEDRLVSLSMIDIQDETKGYQKESVNYAQIVAPLVKAIQELQAQINELKER